MNLINGFQIFKKYKSVLIEILVEYYGCEYADLIKERLNNVYYNFSSTPVDDYKYVINHADLCSYREIIMTKLRYSAYKNVEEKLLSVYYKMLKEKIVECFQINDLILDSKEECKFLSLFFRNDFRSSYIDYFSSKSLNMLKNPNMSDDIVRTIEKNRKGFQELLNGMGVRIKKLDPQAVDDFMRYRENVKIEYQNALAKNCKFGKDFYNDVRKMDVLLDDVDVSHLCFIKTPCAGTFYDEQTNIECEFLKLPLTHLANLGIKSLDVSLMHELIHKLGNSKYVMINEVRVQIVALKLTKKLHDRGVFIFDNPADYKLEGQCKYERLFPLAYDFCEKFEDLFRQYIIRGSEDNYLEDNFGALIKIYDDYLTFMFESMNYFSFNDNNYNYVKKLIELMEEEYRNNVVEDVLKKIRKKNLK